MIYQLTGMEEKRQTKERAPCGEIIKTAYFNGDKLVRQDIVVNVDASLISKAETKGVA